MFDCGGGFPRDRPTKFAGFLIPFASMEGRLYQKLSASAGFAGSNPKCANMIRRKSISRSCFCFSASTDISSFACSASFSAFCLISRHCRSHTTSRRVSGKSGDRSPLFTHSQIRKAYPSQPPAVSFFPPLSFHQRSFFQIHS